MAATAAVAASAERIVTFVFGRVLKGRRRAVTVVQLWRALTAGFGAAYFRRQQNAVAVRDAMEYMLYTGRLVVVAPESAASAFFTRVITYESLNKLNHAFYSNSSNVLAQNACTKFDPFQIALSRQRIQDQAVHDNNFSIKIKGSGSPISNQKNSGRCWIFACLNVMRVPFMKKYNIKQFEFSQAYLFFWDKIERSNYFLNAIVSTAQKGYSLNSRTVMCLLKNPVEDGGYWSMAANIIQKYGLMPKLDYPESYSSQDSRELNDVLNSKLREFAIVLHGMVAAQANAQQISDEIERAMCTVYRIVGICLGVPRATFKWPYRVGGDRSCVYKVLTPVEFYETVVRPTFDLNDKVSLINDPRASAEFGRLYTVDLIGNVVEGSGVLYNNQPMDVLVEACRQSVTVLGEPVWYSCDVDQKFVSELGVEDLQIYNMQSLFGTDISMPMTKSERILYRDSGPTHAMVLTGVHINDGGEVTRWRAENSWGKHMHVDGRITVTADWFREYVFEVVVDKSLLPGYVLDVYGQEPIVLPVWDQFGASAFAR